jgi:HSP20 family protein
MLTRWQPLTEIQNEMGRLQQEFERLFGRNGGSARSVDAGVPALNVWQNDDNFIVEAEVPGLQMNEIELLVDRGNLLTLKGERIAPHAESATWHRRERGFGSFSRTIELPGMIDAEGVEAVLKNGVLTITLPKPEEAKPRKVAVKAK